MVQQGQVFKLKTTGPDGKPLWAYRYRLHGRGSKRLQVGGLATRVEAQQALQKTLDRLRPGGRAATLTLAELVDEYLQTQGGERVTIAKLRWLLRKATATLGEVRRSQPRSVGRRSGRVRRCSRRLLLVRRRAERRLPSP